MLVLNLVTGKARQAYHGQSLALLEVSVERRGEDWGRGGRKDLRDLEGLCGWVRANDEGDPWLIGIAGVCEFPECKLGF